MIPFRTDPRWYEERWYGDSPDKSEVGDSETGPPLRLRTGRLGRVAVCLALVAALPTLSYLGFEAAAQNPDAALACQH